MLLNFTEHHSNFDNAFLTRIAYFDVSTETIENARSNDMNPIEKALEPALAEHCETRRIWLPLASSVGVITAKQDKHCQTWNDAVLAGDTDLPMQFRVCLVGSMSGKPYYRIEPGFTEEFIGANFDTGGKWLPIADAAQARCIDVEKLYHCMMEVESRTPPPAWGQIATSPVPIDEYQDGQSYYNSARSVYQVSHVCR